MLPPSPFRRRGPAPRPRQDALAAPGAGWPEPWVQLKYFTYHPAVYPRFIAAASPRIAAGDLVTVYDREGTRFGLGYFHHGAPVPLRMLAHGREEVADAEGVLDAALDRAVELRVRILALPERTDAFRVVHSDADGLGGLVVDRYADVLVVLVSNAGALRRVERWVPRLHAALGTRRAVVRVTAEARRVEGLREPAGAREEIGPVKIVEDGVRYEVVPGAGHKTGYFCDQRDNRRRFAALARGRRVLDLCCHAGGFSLAALRAGAEEATGVDLDEEVVEQARRNANLNRLGGAQSRWIHADAYSWCRQMQENGERWGAVVVDPPKFVEGRDDVAAGRRRYEDLNRLALGLVEPGGFFVTCSCSGLLPEDLFEETVVAAAHRLGRRLQFLERTGAGPDHPVLSICPETRYLKVLWARVL